MDKEEFLKQFNDCCEKLGVEAKVKVEIQGSGQFAFIPYDDDKEGGKVINIIRIN